MSKSTKPPTTDKSKITVYDEKKHDLNYTFNYNSKETKELRELLDDTASISTDLLRRISLWKSSRVLNVSDDLLNKLTGLLNQENLSLEDDNVKEIIELLVASNGIGYPMASTILKFIRPDIFPIIDVRAYRALTGKKLSYTNYTYEKYIEYAKKVKEIATDKSIELNMVDEQLYEFDKAHNGKI